MSLADREKREVVCFCCLHAKARKDLALTMTDPRVPEWQTQTFAKLENVHVCKDCWEERKVALPLGVRGAVEREERELRQGVKLAKGDMT